MVVPLLLLCLAAAGGERVGIIIEDPGNVRLGVRLQHQLDLRLGVDSATVTAIVTSRTSTSTTTRIDEPLEQETVQLAVERALEQRLAFLLYARVVEKRLRLFLIEADGSLPVLSIDMENTIEGARGAVAQLLFQRMEMHSDEQTRWMAWVGAGAGAVSVGVGIAMRIVAADTQQEIEAKSGALTQTEAFELRDRGTNQARSGLVLIVVGSAVIVATATWLVGDWMD